MEEGIYFETEQGTPQGGVLSPVLANVYLHYVLDSWFETEVIPQLNGFAQLVRYADDFVVCFENEKEAKVFGIALRSLSSDDSHATEQGNMALNAKPLTFWVLRTFAIRPEEANSSLVGRHHARSSYRR